MTYPLRIVSIMALFRLDQGQNHLQTHIERFLILRLSQVPTHNSAHNDALAHGEDGCRFGLILGLSAVMDGGSHARQTLESKLARRQDQHLDQLSARFDYKRPLLALMLFLFELD